MAFFKFRKAGDEPAAPSPAPESVEALRRRARHRLIGAAVLVLIGVIGFPLVFDNQPRPVAVDIPIDIPDRAKVAPLTLPTPAPAQTAAASSTPVINETAAGNATPPPAPAPARVSGGSVTAPKPEAPKVAEVKQAEKPQDRTPPKPVAAKPDESAKAQALLEGKEPPKPAATASAAAGARYIVQVGAFADVQKAREARMKLERAGLKTYTQVVNPPEGRRIRVRVGPMESKGEADKVADKIKKLDLPASVLEL